MSDVIPRYHVLELNDKEHGALLRLLWRSSGVLSAGGLEGLAKRLERDEAGLTVTALRQIVALGGSEPYMRRRGHLPDDVAFMAIEIAANALESLGEDPYDRSIV